MLGAVPSLPVPAMVASLIQGIPMHYGEVRADDSDAVFLFEEGTGHLRSWANPNLCLKVYGGEYNYRKSIQPTTYIYNWGGPRSVIASTPDSHA